MQTRKLLIFLLQAVAVGLAAAAVLLFLQSGASNQPVVEIIEGTRPKVPQEYIKQPDWRGPVSYAAAVALAPPAVVYINTAKNVTERSDRVKQ